MALKYTLYDKMSFSKTTLSVLLNKQTKTLRLFVLRHDEPRHQPCGHFAHHMPSAPDFSCNDSEEPKNTSTILQNNWTSEPCKHWFQVTDSLDTCQGQQRCSQRNLDNQSFINKLRDSVMDMVGRQIFTCCVLTHFADGFNIKAIVP